MVNLSLYEKAIKYIFKYFKDFTDIKNDYVQIVRL